MRRVGKSYPLHRAPKSAGSAFSWSLANTMISRLGTLGIGIVLARILGPEEFGTFAIALVALMAVLSFNELGVSLAIVRWPGDPGLIASTVNTLSVLGSTLFCALAWWAAPQFSELMGDPQATPVVRILILSVLLNGIVAGPAALLQRAFEERTRMAIDQANVWIGAILSVLLVFLGLGAMALAIGRLAGSFISALMFLRASPIKYRLGWNRGYASALVKFGLPLAGSSLIVFAVGYADQLSVGAMLGSVALGFYVLAFNLSSWPLNIISQPLRRVAPAAFSALQSDGPRLQEAITGLLKILACATIPAFLALSAAATPLVRFIYGSEWIPAAQVLSWLVIVALAKVFNELVYDYLVVVGRTNTVLAIQALGLCLLVPALVIGARTSGIAGVAVAYAVVSVLFLLPVYLWQLRRAGVGFTAVLKQLCLPLLAGVAAWAACTAATHFIALDLVDLAVGGTLTLALILLLLWNCRSEIQQIRRISRTESLEAAV
jgi:O-antigen/teichoic acid export membrane protein